MRSRLWSAGVYGVQGNLADGKEEQVGVAGVEESRQAGVVSVCKNVSDSAVIHWGRVNVVLTSNQFYVKVQTFGGPPYWKFFPADC